MTLAVLLVAVALIFCLAAAIDLLAPLLRLGEERAARDPAAREQERPPRDARVAAAVARLELAPRLASAGLADRISVRALLAAKLGGALAGVLWAIVIAPATPGRLAWIVALALPAADSSVRTHGSSGGPGAGSARCGRASPTRSICSRWEPRPGAAHSRGWRSSVPVMDR